MSRCFSIEKKISQKNPKKGCSAREGVFPRSISEEIPGCFPRIGALQGCWHSADIIPKSCRAQACSLRILSAHSEHSDFAVQMRWNYLPSVLAQWLLGFGSHSTVSIITIVCHLDYLTACEAGGKPKKRACDYKRRVPISTGTGCEKSNRAGICIYRVCPVKRKWTVEPTISRGSHCKVHNELSPMWA